MRFVFLLYVSRSGSTVVAQNIQDGGADVVVLPENRLVETVLSEGPHLERRTPRQLAAILRTDPQFASFAYSEAELGGMTREAAGKGPRALLEGIARTYSKRQNRTAGTCVYKHGTNLPIASKILDIIPDARFVHVYRDCRAAASSMLQSRHAYMARDRMGRGNAAFIAREWRDYVRSVAALKSSRPGSVVELRYEDLCREPEQSIRHLLQELEIPVAEDSSAGNSVVAPSEMYLHQRTKLPIDEQRVDAWKSELSRNAGVIIESLAGAEMVQRGYALYYLPATPLNRVRLLLGCAFVQSAFYNALYFVRRLPYYVLHPRAIGVRLRVWSLRLSSS